MHTALRHTRALFLKKRPVHLTFFVTRRCNARCPFCFYAERRDAEGGAPELSLDEIRRVAGSMDELLWVLFSGGEVFLRDDLVEASGIFHDRNRARFLTYPTNGLLPEVIAERTEEILRRCPESVVVVKLSLDGVGAAHDRLRQVPGGFERLLGAHERLAALARRHPRLELGVNTLYCPENQGEMDGIIDFVRLLGAHERLAALARRHPRLELGVNTLYCPENQGEMDGIIDFVRALEGVRSHTLTMIRPDARGGTCAGVDLARYERAGRRLERCRAGRFHRFAGARLKAAQDRLQRRLVHRTLRERRRLLPCYAGRLNLVLSETGALYPCEGRWDGAFGNVREAGYDVGALLRSERARRIRDDIAEGGCWCSRECNLLTNILFNPAMHPGLLREWARLGLEGGRRGEGDAREARATTR